MTTYNHLLCLTFTVQSKHSEGEDITFPQIEEALEERLQSLRSTMDYKEVCLPPIDTFEEDV